MDNERIIPSDDLELLDLLDEVKFDTFDKAADIYLRRAIDLRTRLLGYVKSLNVRGLDQELIVDEAIEKGFKIITAQYNGHLDKKAFKFSKQFGLGLVDWLICIIGNSIPGPKGGIVLSHKRKVDKYPLVSDSEYNISTIIDYSDNEQKLNLEILFEGLKKLKDPKRRFIIESYYGLHDELTFSATDLKKRVNICNLKYFDKKDIISRAKLINIPTKSKKLTRKKLALLLDRSVKQISRDIDNTLKELSLILDTV